MKEQPSFSKTERSSNIFDAIVIGSGISGGWAAKELCDKGLKTLVLERGRDVVHLKDYPTATKILGTFHIVDKKPMRSQKEIL